MAVDRTSWTDCIDFAIGRLVDGILAQTVTKNNVIMTFGILVTAIVIRFVCDEMATRASFAASVDVKES